MKRMLNRLFLVLVLGGVAMPASAMELPDSARTEHVIIISIDGLRPDAIEAFGLETLQRLMAAGSYSLDARTIFPSKTLPSHTSMLTGRTPEFHGITFNRSLDEEGIVRVPTIFEIARLHGYRTAAFYSKAKFRHLDREDSYDYRQVPAYNTDNWMATRTAPDAITYLRHRRPNLLFIHIGETDYAGHSAGWMSFFYGLAARRADAAVKEVVQAADRTYGRGNYTLLVTADHGGHGRSHGTDRLDDMTIPWIAYGESVQRAVRLDGIETMDTAATALWLLGIEIPVPFEGEPVLAAFGAVPAGVPAPRLNGG